MKLLEINSLEDFYKFKLEADTKDLGDVQNFSELNEQIRKGNLPLDSTPLGSLLEILNYYGLPTNPEKLFDNCAELIEDEHERELFVKENRGEALSLKQYEHLKNLIVEDPFYHLYQDISQQALYDFTKKWHSSQPTNKVWNPSYAAVSKLSPSVLELAAQNKPDQLIRNITVEDKIKGQFGRNHYYFMSSLNGWSLAELLRVSYTNI
jgi:hypothetical protein